MHRAVAVNFLANSTVPAVKSETIGCVSSSVVASVIDLILASASKHPCAVVVPRTL